jgi:hypothetical protein
MVKKATATPSRTRRRTRGAATTFYHRAGHVIKRIDSVNAAQTERAYGPGMTLVKTFTTVSDESAQGPGPAALPRDRARRGEARARHDPRLPRSTTANGGLWRGKAQEYDREGRPTRTVNADGTDRLLEYGGCGCAGGPVTYHYEPPVEARLGGQVRRICSEAKISDLPIRDPPHFATTMLFIEGWRTRSSGR